MSIPIPLSGSVGGAPIKLDATTAPGNLIHLNPTDSGGNDIVQNILIGNPNSNQITLEVQTQGPGITTPELIRIDVPPTAEGTEVRLFYTPFLLQPGFSYYIRANLLGGSKEPYLYGYAERHAVAGKVALGGYGGLQTLTTVAIGDVTSPNWITVPFQGTSINVPVNVTVDAAGNQLSMNVEGVWAVTAYFTLQFSKQNEDKVIYTRFWNAADGVPISDNPFPLYIEQQDNGQSFAIPAVPVDVNIAVGKNIQLQIGGSTSDFTNMSINKAGFNVFYLGPFAT